MNSLEVALKVLFLTYSCFVSILRIFTKFGGESGNARGHNCRISLISPNYRKAMANTLNNPKVSYLEEINGYM